MNPRSVPALILLLSGTALAAEGPLYSLSVQQQDVKVVLRELARRAGISITFLPWTPSQLITLDFKSLPLDKALSQILLASDLDYRLVDGIYNVGLAVDLNVRFPREDEKVLDATYRCRRVAASTLADTLSKILPDLKITAGPTFLTPSMDGSGGSGAGDNQLKVLGATDGSLKTHDVVFSGHASMVRRALALAQKFDRPRAQVRLSVKILRVSNDNERSLGIQWMPSLNFNANEVSDGTNGPASAPSVDGIRLGRFTHAPLAVQATLNALETAGKVRVLSKPTLTLLDGERSFVLSGSRMLYPKFTGKDQNGQSLYDVGELKIGVYLQVSVQVGLDNDMVLTLYPQVSQRGEVLSTPNGGQYPEIKTEEIQTTVRAVNGEVLVLGGLLQESKEHTSTGLPFLSRIPILGRLFGSVNNSNNRSELMIVLTPELVEETLPDTKVDLRMEGA